MTRALLALSSGLVALALLAAPAAAQTCACTTYPSARQFVQFNDAIFKGKVVSSRQEYGSATTHFQVLEALKGELGAHAAVSHPVPGPGTCGGVNCASASQAVNANASDNNAPTTVRAPSMLPLRRCEPRLNSVQRVL